MSWGLKKGFSLFISGFTTGYATEKFSELKETCKDFSKKDRETVNNILRTGEFKLPPADEQEEESKEPEIKW